MKVGVLTVHYIPNMGAVLQAYATLKKLCELFPGIEVELIDYRDVQRESVYSSVSESIKKKGLVRGIEEYLRSADARELRKRLGTFYTEKLGIASVYNTSFIDCNKMFENYDAIIVGSDQVWNPYLTTIVGKKDFTYLLNGYAGLKFSYASSFGLDSLPDEFVKRYKIALSQFKLLSSREKQGKQIIENQLGLEAKEVLDPTLLLNSDEWNKSLDITDEKEDERYIFVYIVKNSKRLIRYAQNLSKQTGLELRVVSTPILRGKYSYLGCKCAMSPSEWLGDLCNARYVVTNSFHGVAFSINYGKEVYFESDNPNSLAMSRLQNICKNFELESHVIKNENAQKLEPLDYEKIYKELEIRRSSSFEYLSRIKDYIKRSGANENYRCNSGKI